MNRVRLFCLAWLVVSPALTAFGDSGDQPGADVLIFEIIPGSDDGTEIDKGTWCPDGYEATGLNRMGNADSELYDVGLRFHVPHVLQGERFAYARLVLSGTGEGQVDSGVALRIVGIDQDGVADFAADRPSRLPKTQSFVEWQVSSNWPATGDSPASRSPLLRYSPNIAAVINEIVGRPGWGRDQEGKTLGLMIEGTSTSGRNFLAIEDSDDSRVTILELYRDAAFFVGKELLGRPTDNSITINAMPLLSLDVYVEYGLTEEVDAGSTLPCVCPGGTPFEITLSNLLPGTFYYYRLRYRRPGDGTFSTGSLRSFHTCRAAGATFRFTIQSDSHIWEAVRQRQVTLPTLYNRALAHVAADVPDFHIVLGDTFMCEDYSGGDVRDYEDAVVRHLAQRHFLDLIGHSVPLFFVLGNHEGEQGWRLDGTPDNVAVWATNARKLLYPNPIPDGFYTGCTEESEFVGLPENYYAFEWGDALFVMLDPYRYTTVKPHSAGGPPGSGDNWDWTLGLTQYNWLQQTLANSTARFKFVFAHQVTGGADLYGRGGVEAATHAPAHPGSFEWGGKDLTGSDVFDQKRPDWGVPVHQLLVDHNVSIFFHGHDHVFVKQDLDGVVYQECPVPSDGMYGYGHYGYIYGDLVNNSGHLRVEVSQDDVSVDYVRAFLPGDGEDGIIAYSYTIVPVP